MNSFWPWDSSIDKRNKLRMMEVARDGSIGYLVHYTEGIFSFYPQNGTAPQPHAFLPKAVLHGQEYTGISISSNRQFVVVTGGGFISLVDLSNYYGPNSPTAVLPVDLRHCFRRSAHIRAREAVLMNDNNNLYAVGRTIPGPLQKEYGSVLLQISARHGSWDQCTVVAGTLTNPYGWRDGSGESVQMTRPHAMVQLPGVEALVITDIDNRAVRYANVSDPHKVHVSTISYNENNLWQRLQTDDATTVQQEESIRVGPATRDATTLDLDANQAASSCQARDSGGLCSLSTIRSYWESLDWNDDTGDSILVWTRASCASCWLRWPGDCQTQPLNNNESSSQSWGTEFQMIATLTRQGIQTDCILSNARVPTTRSLCCATNNIGSSKRNKERTKVEDSSSLVLFLGVTITTIILIALTQCFYGKRKFSTIIQLPKLSKAKTKVIL